MDVKVEVKEVVQEEAQFETLSQEELQRLMGGDGNTLGEEDVLL